MNQKTSAINARAAEMMRKMSITKLLDLWEHTESMPMVPNLPIVRGWIGDALEMKDPDAFNAWLDCDDPYAKPEQFFTK